MATNSSLLRIWLSLQAVNILIYAGSIIVLFLLDKITSNGSYTSSLGPPLLLLAIAVALNGAQIFGLTTFIMAPRLYKKHGFSPDNPDIKGTFPWSLAVNQRNNICPAVTYRSLLIFSWAASGILGGLISFGLVFIFSDGQGVSWWSFSPLRTMVEVHGQGFWVPIILLIISFIISSLVIKKILNLISFFLSVIFMFLFFPLSIFIGQFVMWPLTWLLYAPWWLRHYLLA